MDATAIAIFEIIICLVSGNLLKSENAARWSWIVHCCPNDALSSFQDGQIFKATFRVNSHNRHEVMHIISLCNFKLSLCSLRFCSNPKRLGHVLN